MARNIEIKARAFDFARQRGLAAAQDDGDPQVLVQEDVFYQGDRARLKLRVIDGCHGQLIAYRRPDQTGPKTSHYLIHHTRDPDSLVATLDVALTRLGVVRKRRTLFLAGRTRIHLDEVEGLGLFIELEVVLAEGESELAAHREARRLMDRLEIRPEHLVSGAYLDLLLNPGGSQPE